MTAADAFRHDAKVTLLEQDSSGQIPALRPLLPSSERLLPYLRRIDATRIYSNWGPLVDELQMRLSEQLGLPPGGVASASSGTAALVGAILATAGRATNDRPLALVPGLTFVATASAVEQCGFQPYPVDVDPATWMLDPVALRSHGRLDQVGVVVPVAPFGRPVPQKPWLAFRDETGIPVVIDGAAAFDRLVETPGSLTGGIPVALSFHATKAFSTGEGGGVACSEVDLIPAIVQALNFGFSGTRVSSSPNVNGKLSEYHAAVGLAELDGWGSKLDALMRVAEQYRARLAQTALDNRLIAFPDVGASYVLFHCSDRRELEQTEHALDRDGISSRRWYGAGLLEHSHLASLPHDELPVSEKLASCLLGLPLAPDLSEPAIGRVVAALHDAG